MVIAVAWDPRPVWPSLILEQDATGGLTQGYKSPCPDCKLQMPILGYCYADPGTSTVLIIPAVICTHARGV